ncbi:protoglobin domain-containing protein [Xanthocytophaga flava]|uniref:protoglobin domain-containing protein n=1 Tax=Xanthocytophaga flava TaxID=3048013 RepID=UPI0028D008B2|nr:protoglobin domain-containing protein [Xanthocytophaga flavus]MDJ1471111.1 protoglobin domain-containing protein [Xanthocytophaga flavus]
MHTQTTQIPGYTYGEVATSPVSEADLDLLKQTVLLSEEDVLYLQMAGRVLEDQTENILDVWYGFVGSHPYLAQYFGKNDQLNDAYLASVRKRFGQWIMDTCFRSYDQQWLNYQHEIGLRHLVKKNQTDGVDAVPIIHFRYLVTFIVPITATIKPFLARKGNSVGEVENMYNAWFKAITLTVALWCYPYVKEGTF